jgi:hypothetical protein
MPNFIDIITVPYPLETVPAATHVPPAPGAENVYADEELRAFPYINQLGKSCLMYFPVKAGF